jgi:hypothetical protein
MVDPILMNVTDHRQQKIPDSPARSQQTVLESRPRDKQQAAHNNDKAPRSGQVYTFQQWEETERCRSKMQ